MPGGGGAWSRLSAATSLSGHAAVPATVARPVLMGALVTSAHGASSSGFLPTQQLLIRVHAWETPSAVSPASGGPAPCFSHTVIKCSWRQDPPPTSGLEVPQVSGWATILAAAPVTWMSGPRGQAGPGQAGPGSSAGLPCVVWPC